MIIDLIYIFDTILNFFWTYKSFDENLITNAKHIFIHYIKTYFFIQFIPFFTTFKYLEKLCVESHLKNCSFNGNELNIINSILYIIILIKIIKLVYSLN